ncbi:MAG: hypothetical protein A9Z00_06315 [Thermobacillus sp. ZCTH02-B1]|uniref:hypothetical protein n=1 Tax=Thermobacillus sp. ZCTH02-B1 TaxID=1858795 RepID=UPI000B584775|nr:hypothetical protein [Thermobacillus sp. ZCTH02-B1]OUM95973.1 MAG: hypothetical protein A9Z00_06315 [Thermobacillus sp. ZCTH02-B1]
MEALIGFLFDNLILVIIVIGILTSLFGRAGRQGGGSRMPDFGGGPGSGLPHRPLRDRRESPDGTHPGGAVPGGRWTRREAGGGPPWAGGAPGGPHRAGRAEMPGIPVAPRHADAAGHGPVVTADARLGGQPSAANRSPAPSAAAPASPRTSSPDPSAARTSEAVGIAPALQVERRPARAPAGPDELRKAIIWAEILGPPRALRPYGRRRIGR